ncbi:MAG: hypothetical protein ACRBHB_22885, partial [Arenicella sp.]
CTIRPATYYNILKSVNINGYTQPGSSPNTLTTDQGLDTVLKIVVHGTLSAGATFSLSNHRGSEIQGMAITNTNPGTGNFRSVAVSVYNHDNSSDPGHSIKGVFIGTDEKGEETVGEIRRAMAISLANNVQLGGVKPEDRNLLMPSEDGIYARNADALVIEGNLIGTDITGNNYSGMTQSMINFVTVTNSRIGTEQPGGRNVLSGAASAWSIYMYNSMGNQVSNNMIGATVAEQVIPQSSRGIYVLDSSNNDIKGNTISATNTGVSVFKWQSSADNNILQGNYIGVNSAGSLLSAGSIGVYVYGVGNLLGGINTGEGNVIANYTKGIIVGSELAPGVFAVGNTISGNAIYNNATLGIDLGGSNGVSLNDELDSDLGGNHLQNFPVVTVATANSLTGTLSSEVNKEYRIELFANTECGASGYGSGEQFLGYVDVTTDSSGTATFSMNVSLSVGTIVTATATDMSSGNSSEFSECKLVNN